MVFNYVIKNFQHSFTFLCFLRVNLLFFIGKVIKLTQCSYTIQYIYKLTKTIIITVNYCN
jgi:hypothetical protein